MKLTRCVPRCWYLGARSANYVEAPTAIHDSISDKPLIETGQLPSVSARQGKKITARNVRGIQKLRRTDIRSIQQGYVVRPKS